MYIRISSKSQKPDDDNDDIYWPSFHIIDDVSVRSSVRSKDGKSRFLPNIPHEKWRGGKKTKQILDVFEEETLLKHLRDQDKRSRITQRITLIYTFHNHNRTFF